MLLHTSHGSVAYEEFGRGETTVVFIHGNSSCRHVFAHQFTPQFLANYRVLTLDLPGHGDSDNSPQSHITYTLTGLADAVIEVLGKLEIIRPVLVGWSLGGHIAVEILSRLPLKGLFLCGAPPVGKVNGINDMKAGFMKPPSNAAVQESWSREDAQAFVSRIFERSQIEVLIEAAQRVDPKFRTRLLESAREGAGVNQRAVVEASPAPIAIVNGAHDPIVNLDYFDSLQCPKMWRDAALRIANTGHAPFWQAPVAFNELLKSFLIECEERDGNGNSSTPAKPS